MSHGSLPVTPKQIAALPTEFRALLRSVIEHFEKRIADPEGEIAGLKDRVVGLQAEADGLRKTSRNSSLPPSIRTPNRRPRGVKSGRMRGRQPERPRHERPLIPATECEDVVPCVPEACRRCGGALSGLDAEPLRHLVRDVAEIKPPVIEC